MAHQITSRREVPVSKTLVGALTGKRATEMQVNGGRIGICVKLENGSTAWGFGATDKQAEVAAVNAAEAI